MINVSLTAELKCEDDRTYRLALQLFRDALTTATEGGAVVVKAKSHAYEAIVEEVRAKKMSAEECDDEGDDE